jgi:hypothetical protein
MRSDRAARTIEDTTLNVHGRTGGECERHCVGRARTDDANISTLNDDADPRRRRPVVRCRDDDVIDAAAKLPDDIPKQVVRMGLLSLRIDDVLISGEHQSFGWYSPAVGAEANLDAADGLHINHIDRLDRVREVVIQTRRALLPISRPNWRTTPCSPGLTT